MKRGIYISIIAAIMVGNFALAGTFSRPKGATRFQELSVARQPLPSAELDNEFNAVRNWLNDNTTFIQNVSEWSFFQSDVVYTNPTQFTVAGDATDIFNLGRAIKAGLNGNYVYSHVTNSSYSAGTGKTTITIDTANLTSALTSIYYGILSANSGSSIPSYANYSTGYVKANSVIANSVIANDVISSGPLADARAFSNLSTALASPATLGKAIIVSSPMAINDKTVSNRQIKVVKGGRIDIASGKTLTFATGANFDAGEFQAFGGNGSVISLKYAKLDWFGVTGNGVDSDQAPISKAMVATTHLHINKPSVKYKVDTLAIPSNITIDIESGTVVEANTGFTSNQTLLDFDGASNVVINAAGTTFQMLKSEYSSGEWRHCFNLINCSKITINGPVTAKDSGGDGYYINGATDVVLNYPIADNNRRQGMSIISADSLTVFEPVLKNTTGTTPQSGLDIEPNEVTDVLKNINIIKPLCENNAGPGIQIYLDSYKTGTPSDISISIISPVTRSNDTEGIRIKNVFLNSGGYGGFINVTDPVSIEDGKNGIFIQDKSVNAPLLSITNPIIINPVASGTVTLPEYSAVYITDTSSSASGGIHIDSLKVKSTNAYMKYGLWVEAGQGFADSHITIAEITGYTTDPCRFNSYAASTANTLQFGLFSRDLKPKAWATGGQLLNQHSSYTNNNTGASGSVTFFMKEYLPIGLSYRVKVTAAQPVIVDTFTAGDQIVGSSASGKYMINSGTIGAEIEMVYIGGQLWQPRIISGTWTYEP